ncbi:hypothetical protein BC940DRAFT_34384 [Gongronella butleri]|nr:hypothetical protein BC940DRAFT_34384 [Gongronella butleri]
MSSLYQRPPSPVYLLSSYSFNAPAKALSRYTPNTAMSSTAALELMHTPAPMLLDDSDSIMLVPQHLDSEQINYEFPPKSELQALSYLDQAKGDEYSFFDETSFTSVSNDASSMLYSECFSSLIDEKTLDPPFFNNHHVLPPMEDDDLSDHHLSPLQLPAQAHHHTQERGTTVSCDRTRTTETHPSNNQLLTPRALLYKDASLGHAPHRSMPPAHHDEDDHPMRIIMREAEPMLDSDDDSDSLSSLEHHLPPQQVILVKINKKAPESCRRRRSRLTPSRCTTSLTFLTRSPVHDDDEIESASVFLPLSDTHHMEPCSSSSFSLPIHAAASAPTQPPRAVAPGPGMHHHHHHHHDDVLAILQGQEDRIAALERQLNEERAMRQAFEKAMEEMTVLIDQQQKLLYDRLDQEVAMRQVYEDKMHTTLQHMQPLEDHLEKETLARQNLESIVLRLMDQVDFLQHDHHLRHAEQPQQLRQNREFARQCPQSAPSFSSSTTSSVATSMPPNNTSTRAPSRQKQQKRVSPPSPSPPSSSLSRNGVIKQPATKPAAAASAAKIMPPASRPPPPATRKPIKTTHAAATARPIRSRAPATTTNNNTNTAKNITSSVRNTASKSWLLQR